MAEEAAATPVTEAAPQAPTSAPEAVSFIGQALARQEGRAPQAETTQDAVPPHPNAAKPAPGKDPSTGRFTKAEPAPESEAEPEANAEQAEAEESTEREDTEQQTQSDEEVEVPDDWRGLAEKLGVDPADLAGHVHFEIKGEDGTPQRVSAAELIRGHLRADDYTRKTTQLADERKQLDARTSQAHQALSAKHQQIDQVLTVLTNELQMGPTPEQIMALADPSSPTYNPTEYVTARAQYEKRAGAINQAMAVRTQEQQRAEAERKQKRDEFRATQQKKLAALVPETADRTKLPGFEKAVRDYLTKDLHPTERFSDEEVDSFFQTYDARQVLLIRDGMAYRQLVAGKDQIKKLKGLPKVSKPTGPGQRKDTSTTQRAKSLERLSRPGASKADAINFIKNII